MTRSTSLHSRPSPNHLLPLKTSLARLVETPVLYETENDLPKSRRIELIALLNQRLSCAVDLQLQLKQAHWNVKGPAFIALHELFDHVAAAATEYVDLIAERVVQLGGAAEGTVRTAAAKSRLPEYPPDIADGLAHIEAVARAISAFSHESRATIAEAGVLGDLVTVDIFTDISRGLDTWLWQVEAHAQAKH